MDLFHYLDVFCFGYDLCFNLLNTFVEVASRFGIPLAEEKKVLPYFCLDFLRISIDSVKMCFILPEEMLLKIRGYVGKKENYLV